MRKKQSKKGPTVKSKNQQPTGKSAIAIAEFRSRVHLSSRDVQAAIDLTSFRFEGQISVIERLRAELSHATRMAGNLQAELAGLAEVLRRRDLLTE